jgi:hypothetical protein
MPFLWPLKITPFAHKKDTTAILTCKRCTASSGTVSKVLKVLRFIVYLSLIGNFHLKAKYINTAFNSIADALSRAQFQKLNSLCHKQIAKAIGNISKNVMSLKISELCHFFGH